MKRLISSLASALLLLHAAPLFSAPPDPKPEKKDRAPYAYDAVDSASMGNEVRLSPDRLVVENRDAEGDSADRALTSDSLSGAAVASIVDGFRIQVYATTDHLEAERKKEDLAIALDNKVYVVYEAPYYKLRAGNFLKEEDAKKLKKTIAELGYDAYIVKSKIRAPAQPR
jgi:hypothetical protein